MLPSVPANARLNLRIWLLDAGSGTPIDVRVYSPRDGHLIAGKQFAVDRDGYFANGDLGAEFPQLAGEPVNIQDRIKRREGVGHDDDDRLSNRKDRALGSAITGLREPANMMLKTPYPRFLEWVAIVAIAVARLWLTAVRTLRAIGWASIDDYWFLQRGRSIMAGQWMGPYNHLTLVKGAGYPLWIAAISSLHIPLLFAQQLLYTLACLAICRAVAPLVRSAPARVRPLRCACFQSDELRQRHCRSRLARGRLSRAVSPGLCRCGWRVSAAQRSPVQCASMGHSRQRRARVALAHA